MFKFSNFFVIFIFSLLEPFYFQTVDIWLTDPDNNIWFVQQPSQSFSNYNETNSSYSINVTDTITYQTMDGFGASLTDSSCSLLKYQLTDLKRDEILKLLFTKNGIGLSLLRQPIGAPDFSRQAWSLDDTLNNTDDFNLNRFSLWHEDDAMRPILDAALNISQGRVKIFATPWSPPAWMKTGKNLFGAAGGTLRNDTFDVYAEYFVKYIQECENRGTPIYAITVQNEPLYAPQYYPGMYFSVDNETKFIGSYIGPKLRQTGINVKIVGYDHNFDIAGYNYSVSLLSDTNANEYSDGIGFHTYTYPQHERMTQLHNLFPSKNIWVTEAGTGTWIGPYNAQFQDQMMHLIRSPLNWAKGVIFWNVALDQNAGPKLVNVDTTNTNRGIITIRSDTIDSYSFESGYYSMAHSARFVDPGAFRIDSNSYDDDVENVAYLNLDMSIVVVISNRTPNQRSIQIKWKSKSIWITLPGSCAVTLTWNSS